jgi:hypothetical protein
MHKSFKKLLLRTLIIGSGLSLFEFTYTFNFANESNSWLYYFGLYFGTFLTSALLMPFESHGDEN